MTYPDGSKEVPVKGSRLHAMDADKMPIAKDQTVNIGETPDAKGSIGNKQIYQMAQHLSNSWYNNSWWKRRNSCCHYPDGSMGWSTSYVTVKDPRTDADKNTPTPDQTVNIGETPDAKGSIGNISDLQAAITFEYKTVDTTTVGERCHCC